MMVLLTNLRLGRSDYGCSCCGHRCWKSVVVRVEETVRSYDGRTGGSALPRLHPAIAGLRPCARESRRVRTVMSPGISP